MTSDQFLHKMRNFAQIVPDLKRKLCSDYDSFCVDKIDDVCECLDFAYNEIFNKENQNG